MTTIKKKKHDDETDSAHDKRKILPVKRKLRRVPTILQRQRNGCLRRINYNK